jgi:hypothetical protein
MVMTDDHAVAGETACWFKYGATLRIFGQIPDLDEITTTLRLTPTHTHRRGDQRHRRSLPFEHDHWSYDSPVPEDRPLDVHIQTLWNHIKPHRQYLMGLKERLTVDVFCRYTSSTGTAGFEVSHQSLEIFIQLEIPFGISIIA